jgi:hypothetical protein
LAFRPLTSFDFSVFFEAKGQIFPPPKICPFARASLSFVSERRSIPPQGGILEC